jgi:integrase
MGKCKYGHWDDIKNKYRDLVPYVDDVLETLSKTSQQKYFNQIVDVALFLRERYDKGLLEAQGTELKRYFKEEIDSRSIKKSTKKMYRYYVSGYYSEVQRLKKDLENDHDFVNPVPSNKTLAFSGIDRPLKLNRTKEVLTVDHAKQILEHIFFTRNTEQVFYASALIVFSGARVSEVCEIKLNKLNIEDRWFINRVKSQKQDKREGIYFFPSFFQGPLYDYVDYITNTHNNAKYLFESPYNNGPTINRHISKKTVQNAFTAAKKTLGIKVQVSPHPFRNLLNTKRYEAGIRKEDLKFLLNHKQNETYAANYLKNRQNRVFLRDLYDKSCPYTKDILPSLVYNENPIF